MSEFKSHYGEYGPKVDRLIEAAREFWDHHKWTIELKLYSDGTITPAAFSTVDPKGNGIVERERLFYFEGNIVGGTYLIDREQIEDQRNPRVVKELDSNGGQSNE